SLALLSFFSPPLPPPALHSFPTRRSSDLILFICGGAFANLDKVIERRIGHKGVGFGSIVSSKHEKDTGDLFEEVLPEDLVEYGRSEEHTSELQSRSDLVCRLLLEKKKK